MSHCGSSPQTGTGGDPQTELEVGWDGRRRRGVDGVDPHRDSHAVAVVDARTGVVVFETTASADTAGYERLLALATQHAAEGRVFAVEGTGSYGAGLTRFLLGHGEQVLEVGRLRRERRSGGKTDALDAVRAARSVLTGQAALPRAGGQREALRVLMAAREGAVNAKRAGMCQLRDLLVTCPEPLRSELRALTELQLLRQLAGSRPDQRRDPELRGTGLALRAIARRVLQLRTEERELAVEITTLVKTLAPQLLNETGVGPADRSPNPARVVTPRTHPQRSRVRTTRRRRPDPRLLRPDGPLPPRPRRRPQAQPRPPPNPHHPPTLPRAHDHLHPETPRRRQNTTRSHPAASSATSPATSTASSKTEPPPPLDKHRSIGTVVGRRHGGNRLDESRRAAVAAAQRARTTSTVCMPRARWPASVHHTAYRPGRSVASSSPRSPGWTIPIRRVTPPGRRSARSWSSSP